jgi:hypothetical protein
MKAINSKLFFKIIFLCWTGIWLLFLIRGLAKGEISDYKHLLAKTLEEKRAYVTGEEFYEFIQFCRNIIPEDSDYTLVADYDKSIHYFTFAYYMYPSLRNLSNPEYIACYKVKFKKRNYDVIASLSKDKYILKKIERYR